MGGLTTRDRVGRNKIHFNVKLILSHVTNDELVERLTAFMMMDDGETAVRKASLNLVQSFLYSLSLSCHICVFR